MKEIIKEKKKEYYEKNLLKKLVKESLLKNLVSEN